MDARIHRTRRRASDSEDRPRVDRPIPDAAHTAASLALDVVAGPARGMRIALDEPTLTIGRAIAGYGQLGDDHDISDRHVRIDVLDDRGLLVEDLRSTAGTYVNGVRIPAPTLVRPGDTISIGATTMRVVDTPAPSAAELARAPSGTALRVVAGPAPGVVIPLPSGPSVLGRRASAGPAFEHDPAIDGEHARVTVYPDGRLLLEDLGSRTGTLVNGIRIPAPTLLSFGERFQIGASTLEIVEGADVPAALPGDDAALGGVRQVPDELYALIGLRAPVPQREWRRLLVITLLLAIAVNLLIREIAINYLDVADDLRALQYGPLLVATAIQVLVNGFGFYRIFRRPHDESVRRYLVPTVIVPILFLVVNLLRLNHHGGWDIAVTCIVTVLPVALCAAVMLRLRATVAREYVIAARGGLRPPSLTTAESEIKVAPPMPTLKVIAGPAEGRSVDVGGGIVIGRGDVDLSIDDEELSRQHVRIRPVDGGVVIEDLGSTNGSWLNGERINGSVVLTRGGTLRAGRSEIRIEVGRTDSTVVSETPGEVRLSDATVIREIPVELVGAGGDATDDTSVRPRPAMPPPLPLERASSVSARAPEPPPPPPAPSTKPGPSRRSPRVGIAVGILVVAAVVTPLILADLAGSSKSRLLAAKLDLTTITRGRGSLLAGTASGQPLGNGTVTADEVFQPTATPSTPKGIPPSGVPISGKFTVHLDDGSVTTVLLLTATGAIARGFHYTGSGQVIGGTGKYDGASGSFRYEGTQPPLSGNVAATMTGTIRY